jgi:hypothetical protein
MDPWTEFRLNHYKGTGACRRSAEDRSLRDAFTARMEERLSQVYHLEDPGRFYPTDLVKCPAG